MIVKNTLRRLRIKLICLLSLGKSNLKIGEKTLILAPHADDEVLGCGGLIRRAVSLGKEVYVIILTDGSASHGECDAEAEHQIADARRELACSAARKLNIHSPFFLDFPDGKMNKTHPDVEKLHELIKNIQPQQVFIPSHLGGWNDHVVVESLIRPLYNIIPQVYEYCVWFWYYFTWRINWKNARVVRMNKQERKEKKQLMSDYTSALAPNGKPWIGVLPKILLEAGTRRCELYFKIK